MVTAQRRKLFIQPHDLVVWPSMYPGYEEHNERIRRILSGELVYEDQEVQQTLPQQPSVAQVPSRWVNDEDGLRVNIFCNKCGKSYLIPPKHIGVSTPCKDCQTKIHVTRPTSDQIHDLTNHNYPSFQPTPSFQPQYEMTTCPFCLTPRRAAAMSCHACGRTPDGRIGRIG